MCAQVNPQWWRSRDSWCSSIKLVLHEVLLTMTIQESSRIELNGYWNQEWLSLMKWVDCIGLLELTIFLPQKCKIDDFYLQSLLQSEIYSLIERRCSGSVYTTVHPNRQDWLGTLGSSLVGSSDSESLLSRSDSTSECRGALVSLG